EPAIALADQVATDLQCSEVLTPRRDEGEERDHEAVPVTHSISKSDRLPSSRHVLVHQSLANVEKLHAGDDGPRRAWRGSRRIKSRFYFLKPRPVAFRHHQPSDQIKRMDPARDR